MRICVWSIVAVSALLAGSLDESRRFPMANLVDTKIVDQHLMGKPFMPGGTLASYKKGKIAYQMFLARLPSAAAAAFLLLDWKKALAGAHLVPSFGGYFGHDGPAGPASNGAG